MIIHDVARLNEFQELKPLLVDIEGSKVAVYKFKNRYFAYLDRCPHQGGPACEGITIGNMESKVEDGRVAPSLSNERFNIACPWHGIEFDIETGVCRADASLKLRAYEVRIDEDRVVIIR